MAQLFQSAFLQSLGYAIAHSLWQMALIWLLYVGLSNIGSLRASVKYRLGLALQAIGFVWFVFTFQFYYTQYNEALGTIGNVSRNVQAIVSSNTDPLSRLINWMVKGEQLLPYVSAAYLLLIVFLCIRWGIGYRRTISMRSEGLQEMPEEWRAFVDRIAQQMKIGREVRLFLSERISTPLTIGFLKPIILVPLASINHLTTDQLEAVLLHELAHIKRYDYIVNLLVSVVEISLFFNPFTQLLGKSIRKERENCCDDWVLQFQYDGSVYAEALLRIAYLQSTPVFAMAAIGKKKNELLLRVKRMIGEKENRFNYRKQLIAFAIVTGILCSIAWLNPQIHPGDANNKSVRTNQPIIQYAVEPMAVQVDNPLFNPVFFLSKPLKAELEKSIRSAQEEIGEEMVLVPDFHVPLQSIGSITPLVANAMEQAAIAMGDAHSELEELRTNPVNGKTEAPISFSVDSSLFGSNFRWQFKSDMMRAMKEMEDGVKKAKAEIALKMKAGKGELDKLGISKEILDALDELDGASNPFVQKIVLNSLNLTADVLKNLPMEVISPKVNITNNNKERSKEPKKTTEDVVEVHN